MASDGGLRLRKYFGPGTNWEISPDRQPHLRPRLHYSNGLFFNEGLHGFAVSNDDYNWQAINAAFASQDDPERGFTGVVYNGSQWVTTGDVIMVSSDGLSWTFDGDLYDSIEPKLVPPPKTAPAEQGIEANQEGLSANIVRLLINDAVYTGSEFLAVGHQGAIYHISDAGVWTTIPSPVNQDLNDVVFALGQWIAVGNGGTIITSPDAANWTVRNSGIIEDLETVTGDASFALAAGLDGSVLRSSDASTWAETPTGLTSDIRHSAYNGSLWLIGSETQSAFSSDLISWSPGSTDFHSLATNGTLFAAVVGNELQTTPDGVNYTGTGINAESIPYVTYQNGNFYFAANIGLQSSSDGMTWSQVTGTSRYDLFVTNGSVDFLHRHSVGEGHLIGADSASWQATPVHGKVILDDPGEILGATCRHGTHGKSLLQ